MSRGSMKRSGIKRRHGLNQVHSDQAEKKKTREAAQAKKNIKDGILKANSLEPTVKEQVEKIVEEDGIKSSDKSE